MAAAAAETEQARAEPPAEHVDEDWVCEGADGTAPVGSPLALQSPQAPPSMICVQEACPWCLLGVNHFDAEALKVRYRAVSTAVTGIEVGHADKIAMMSSVNSLVTAGQTQMRNRQLEFEPVGLVVMLPPPGPVPPLPGVHPGVACGSGQPGVLRAGVWADPDSAAYAASADVGAAAAASQDDSQGGGGGSRKKKSKKPDYSWLLNQSDEDWLKHCKTLQRERRDPEEYDIKCWVSNSAGWQVTEQANKDALWAVMDSPERRDMDVILVTPGKERWHYRVWWYEEARGVQQNKVSQQFRELRCVPKPPQEQEQQGSASAEETWESQSWGWTQNW
jgi:hypothetical protein